MPFDRKQTRELLKAFDFRRLFLDVLGWDKHTGTLEKQVDGQTVRFQAVSEKRGVVALVADTIPEYNVRVKLEKLIAKDHFEHLLIFADQARGRQVWQWLRREKGKPNALRVYNYAAGNANELLLQKLEHLVVTLDEEEQIGLADILGRVRAGFDVEKVTKRFYDRFKTEHQRFLKFIQGIPDEQMESWYASVMINRLMFLYFIQAKGFLDGDRDYLRNKLAASQDRKQDRYYRDFLCPLFFEGFARRKEERSSAVNALLGEIPYLNGGLFQRHQIEELHGSKIEIPDSAFEHLFAFFREYNWHLDERENRDDREINPDVLGYIFEKYINQKQMGAYYTKEDITEYISKNTIIPFLLDAARKECRIAFDKQTGIWRLLREDPDRYIYEAVRHGAKLELPDEIAIGLDSVPDRGAWNRTAPPEYGLPTEIWREVVERRRRCQEIRGKLANGEVTEVNDLITLNLDIRQFAQDVIQYCEGPELLRALYRAIEKVSVLDPTCGSGAFLFAALNILKPLYEACLQRMQMFVEELDAGGPHHPKKFEDLREILDQSKKHPNQDYFILKSIIVNNLYGVDIMEEAVEICKLRLFLKLVAQVESQDRIEPLPDIDFNIRVGNTLVGFASYNQVEQALGSRLDFEDSLGRIEDTAKSLDAAVSQFRLQQTGLNGAITLDDKDALRNKFRKLDDELHDALAAEYGVHKTRIGSWVASHKPFHWFSDFHQKISEGGFDVIIGNPPYVEHRSNQVPYTLRGFETEECANLWAFVLERSIDLLVKEGRFSLIVPLSLVSADRMLKAYDFASTSSGECWFLALSGDAHPSVLFDGVKMSFTISTGVKGNRKLGAAAVNSSKLYRWLVDERTSLFSLVTYAILDIPKSAPHVHFKSGHSESTVILNKVLRLNRTIGHYVSRGAAHEVLFHRIVRHFVKSMIAVPYFWNERDGVKKSEDYKLLTFPDSQTALVCRSVLISNLFYFYFLAVSDSYHLGRDIILNFPFPYERVSDADRSSLAGLGITHERSLLENSRRRRIRYKATGWIEYDEFYPRLSKYVTDEVDQILGRYYDLSQSEIDFVCSFDIKYRMGTDSELEA
ncbi:MAG: hypothetical protein KJZ70_14410 [Bryobacterales bacterium]|nr:hypothetical protein [Bryobacterales bacterium]